MQTQLKLVAVGYIDTDHPANDTLVCDPSFADTWHESTNNLPVILPANYPMLFDLHDAYEQGVMDRMLGLPSQSCEYVDDGERMAYVAGRCAKRLLSQAEMAAALEELQEGMEDDLYHSRGNW